MKKTVIAGLLAVLLAACEKDLELDYHTVSPIYVCEALLTPNGLSARLSRTQDMSVGAAASDYVDRATVVIRQTGSKWTDTLVYSGSGIYRLDYAGEPGHDYTLDVLLDGRRYSSASTMLGQPVVTSFRFVWQDIVSERILFAELCLDDLPDENNYYFMHLYRNGVGYRWAVMTDRQNPGQELRQLFTCFSRRQMDEGTDSDVLLRGDRLRMEVRSIDRRCYDYLYSLQLMEGSGTNPIANFSGGLLGYFSAYQESVVETVFDADAIDGPE